MLRIGSAAVLVTCFILCPSLLAQDEDPGIGGPPRECDIKITWMNLTARTQGGPWQSDAPADRVVPYVTAEGKATVTHTENVLVIKTIGLFIMTVFVVDKEGNRRPISFSLAEHSGTASNTHHRTKTTVSLNDWNVVDDLGDIQWALRRLQQEEEGLVVESDIFAQFEVVARVRATGITATLAECHDQRELSGNLIIGRGRSEEGRTGGVLLRTE